MWDCVSNELWHDRLGLRYFNVIGRPLEKTFFFFESHVTNAPINIPQARVSKCVNHDITRAHPSLTAVFYGRGTGRTCLRSEAEGYLGDVWAHRWWTAGPWLGLTTAGRWSAPTERPWDSGRTSTSGHRTTAEKTERDVDLREQMKNWSNNGFCFKECIWNACNYTRHAKFSLKKDVSRRFSTRSSNRSSQISN